MAMATMRSGDPIMVRYTPTSAAVATGDVVVINVAGGWTCGIAHHDIAQNVLGHLAVTGGVYDVINLDNAATGAKVYWNAGSSKATTTATSNALLGFVVENGGGGANSICSVYHSPFV